MVSEARFPSSVVTFIGVEGQAYDSVSEYQRAISKPGEFAALFKLLSLPADQRGATGVAFQRAVSDALLSCYGALDPSDSEALTSQAQLCEASLLSFGYLPAQAEAAKRALNPLICAVALEGQWLRELCIATSPFRAQQGDRPFAATEGDEAPNLRAIARIVRAYSVAQVGDLQANVDGQVPPLRSAWTALQLFATAQLRMPSS